MPELGSAVVGQAWPLPRRGGSAPLSSVWLAEDAIDEVAGEQTRAPLAGDDWAGGDFDVWYNFWRLLLL